ncbi:MAG TPA: SpoIIE family protein phosphatase, partial [Thermoanaerobaculia bacterium]
SEMPTFLLQYGQALNALSLLMIYAAGRVLLRSREAGLIAASLAMFVSYYPGFYLSWGRYTHLAGTLVLPALLIALWQLARATKPARWMIASAILASGVLLIHVRVALFALVFAAVMLAATRPHVLRALARWSLAALIAGLLAAPWLIVLVRNPHVGDVIEPVATRGLPMHLVASTHNRELLALATAGVSGIAGWLSMPIIGRALSAAWWLVIVLVSRRKTKSRNTPWGPIQLIGAFVLILAVTLYWKPLGIDLTGFATLDSAIITMFLPLALTGAALIVWVLRMRGIDMFVLIIGLALAGAASTTSIVNPSTVFTDESDLRAMRWISANVPHDAYFAVEGRPWMPPAYVGKDGGYWLHVTTGRRSNLPPLLYAWSLPRDAVDERAAGDLSRRRRPRAEDAVIAALRFSVTVSTNMQSATDRRRAERILLRPPLTAFLDSQEVELHELGPLGCRIEHDEPMTNGENAKLMFSWDGEELTLDCSVVRSGHAPSSRFFSGVSFNVRPAEALRLARVVEVLEGKQQLERLRTIVEASKLINSSIDADSLFDSILSVARAELGVERGTLYFVDEATKEIWSKVAEGLDVREIRLPIGRGLAGIVAESGEPVILHDAYADSRFDRSLDQATGFRTRSMLCVPIRNRERRVVGVLQLLNKESGSFGERDLEFLDAISDHMAIAMENATLHLAIVEKKRMEQELMLGREIQSRLLPKPPSDLRGLALAATTIPCFEVGGDYYDFLELPGGDLGIAIGDVSGKGVSAALIMSSIQAALRVAAPIEPDLASLIARLNALLFRMAGGRKYVTFFFGRYSPATGELRYVNAGHNPPLLITDGEVMPIDSTGRPIGILADATYEERSVSLARGATLFLYTDGLNEANNAAEEEFGNERLWASVARASQAGIYTIAPAVLEDVHAFEEGTHASDDKTIVVLRRI